MNRSQERPDGVHRWKRCALLLLIGCGSHEAVPAATPSPVAELRFSVDGALAYRLTTTLQRPGHEEIRGEHVLYVEQHGEGLVAHGAGARLIPERHSRTWWFPLPGDAEWVIPGQGQTANFAQPDYRVRDTFETFPVEEGLRIITTRVAGFDEEQSCRLEGEYSIQEGRYEHLRAECTVENSTAGMTQTSGWEAHFDAAASLERRQVVGTFPEIRRNARRNFDAYLSGHSAEDEVDATLARSRLPHFYVRAQPALVWQKVITSEHRDHLLALLSAPYAMLGSRLEDELVEVVRQHRDDLAVALLIIHLANDSRFRADVQQMARGADPRVAERAREALSAEPVEPDALRTMSFEELAVGGTQMVLRQDPVALVPVLIDILAEDPEGERAPIVVQWLEAVTLHAHGRDVVAWQAFWESHANQPHREWVIEAARGSNLVMRAAALKALRRETPDPALTNLMTEALEHPVEAVRDNAAQTLLVWNDDVAIPYALAQMESTSQNRRQVGFALIAEVGTHTLGYAPSAPEPERVAAMARWREWETRRRTGRE